MSMYFYYVGRSVRITLLDPDNYIYMERVRCLASFVSEAVEKWERSCDPSLKSTDLPKHLAYVLRKLAEMLPYDDIKKIPEQSFYKNASVLLHSSGKTRSEHALKILCEGFARIQNRLDHGLKPFDTWTLMPILEIQQTGIKDSVAGKRMSFLERKDKTPLLLAN